MVTWIVVAVLILAVLVLVAALAAVGGRLHPLGLALRRLSIRAEQAEGLQRRVETTQLLLLQVQEALEAGFAPEAGEERDRSDPEPDPPARWRSRPPVPVAGGVDGRPWRRPKTAPTAVARRRRG